MQVCSRPKRSKPVYIRHCDNGSLSNSTSLDRENCVASLLRYAQISPENRRTPAYFVSLPMLRFSHVNFFNVIKLKLHKYIAIFGTCKKDTLRNHTLFRIYERLGSSDFLGTPCTQSKLLVTCSSHQAQQNDL